MNTKCLLVVVLGLVLTSLGFGQGLERTPSAEGATVYIISPANGETVSGDVVVLFGLKGMGIAPAGIDLPNTGHHHLLIDAAELPAMDMPMPGSESLKHFGKGQTEVTLTLAPGKHTLQLILGDNIHMPHSPPVISEKIVIMVE